MCCRPHQRELHATVNPSLLSCGHYCFKSCSSSSKSKVTQPEGATITQQRMRQEAGAKQSVDLPQARCGRPADGIRSAAVKQDSHEVKSEPSPMRAAPHPAGASRAAGNSPSIRAAGYSPSSSAALKSVEHSSPKQSGSAAMRGAAQETASFSPADSIPSGPSQQCSRKRKRSQLNSSKGAAATASSPAADESPASSGVAQHRNTKPKKLPLSPVTRSGAQMHSAGKHSISPLSSRPIVISDSDEEALIIPDSDPAQPLGRPLDPNPDTCYTPRIHPKTRGAAASGPCSFDAIATAPNGSADSPFVIEITDSDDDGLLKVHDAGSAARHGVSAASPATTQHQMTRRSDAQGSRQASERKASPSGAGATLQAVPFSLSMTGSPPLSPGPSAGKSNCEGTLPESKQPPLDDPVVPCPKTTKTSTLAAKASNVYQSIKQAARSSALLSVPRPGRSAPGCGASFRAVLSGTSASVPCLSIEAVPNIQVIVPISLALSPSLLHSFSSPPSFRDALTCSSSLFPFPGCSAFSCTSLYCGLPST